VQAIKMHKHESVDLFLLFPLDMALNRMLSYRQETVEQSTAALNNFFGCEDWRPLVSGRITGAQSPDLRRAILDLYLRRLRELGWAHAMVVRDVKRVGASGLYKMIYASNHPAGKNIAEWSAEQPRKRNQLDLF
jgi:three-Cys-motif partner protein